MPKPPPQYSALKRRDQAGQAPVNGADARTHPSYHAARGFVPLDSSGARKKYVKAPV